MNLESIGGVRRYPAWGFCIGIVGMLLTFGTGGCHEHCAPDDTPARQDHTGMIDIVGAVTASINGTEVSLHSPRELNHCVPMSTGDDFCFWLFLPPLSVGEFDLALIDASGLVAASDAAPAEEGEVTGSLHVRELTKYVEDGGGGEGDADLVNQTLRASLVAVLEFDSATVSIDLELDYEDRATLECYSH